LEDLLPAVKCPKCGFVSYAGLDQCKKCSYPFAKSAQKGSSTFLTSLFPEEGRADLPAQADPVLAPMEAELQSQSPSIPEPASDPIPTGQFFSPDEPSVADRLGTEDTPANWREELSDRVVSFRKRRGRVQTDADPSANMELEFENAGKPEEARSIFQPQESSENVSSGFDMDLGKLSIASDESEQPGDKWPPRELGEELQLDAASEDTDEISLGEPVAKRPPMEILVGSPSANAPEDEANAEQLYYAPVNRRLMAGLTDALILIIGAALFGGISWYTMTRFCDHNSLVPFNVAILGLVATIVTFGYFAIFTAITFATPGLLLMGCEIRNLRGEHPTLSESLWRAFGVLVSLSALMLGFVWAYVDSESLTWHDRMSGTIITETNIATDFTGRIAET
jgi:uncharacterized RDD family membrane protein YckC